MEEAKSIISASEFTDSQTNLPPNALANSNGFKDNNAANRIAAMGNLTHVGSSEEHTGGIGGLDGKEQAISEHGPKPPSSIGRGKDGMDPGRSGVRAPPQGSRLLGYDAATRGTPAKEICADVRQQVYNYLKPNELVLLAAKLSTQDRQGLREGRSDCGYALTSSINQKKQLVPPVPIVQSVQSQQWFCNSAVSPTEVFKIEVPRVPLSKFCLSSSQGVSNLTIFSNRLSNLPVFRKFPRRREPNCSWCTSCKSSSRSSSSSVTPLNSETSPCSSNSSRTELLPLKSTSSSGSCQVGACSNFGRTATSASRHPTPRHRPRATRPARCSRTTSQSSTR